MNSPALEAILREVIRDEIRQLVRADALAHAANGNEPFRIEPEDEDELRRKAVEVAHRFRRARSG